eukprot:255169_1
MFFTLINNASETELVYDVNSSNECKTVEKCESLKRVITALHFYQTIMESSDAYTSKNKQILQYIDSNKHLLNDYHHILLDHLNHPTKRQNDNNFSLIYDKCCKYIECSLQKCQYYQRNNRNRCKTLLIDKDTPM